MTFGITDATSKRDASILIAVGSSRRAITYGDHIHILSINQTTINEGAIHINDNIQLAEGLREGGTRSVISRTLCVSAPPLRRPEIPPLGLPIRLFVRIEDPLVDDGILELGRMVTLAVRSSGRLGRAFDFDSMGDTER